MSFNKKYVENISKLKEQYETLGHEGFVKKYLRYDAIIANEECSNFIFEKLNRKSNPKNK